MMESLIEHIKNQVITNRWINNRVGSFEYDSQFNTYCSIGTNQEATQYLIPPFKRTQENTPIVIKNFIAFLITNWGKPESVIYNTYNEICKNQFIAAESNKPGSFRRDLQKEFPINLINKELRLIKEFRENFTYLSKEEKELILEYAKNYIEYTSCFYQTNTKEQEAKFTDLLFHNNVEGLMIVLDEQIRGSKGKKVAAIIKALDWSS